MAEVRKTGQKTVVIKDKALRRFKGGFTMLPNYFLRRQDLSPGAKLTFALLLSYGWDDDFCWPAQERLAQDAGYSVRQIQRYLLELKGKNIIDWKQQGLNRPNIYYILEALDEGAQATAQEHVENEGYDTLADPDTTSSQSQPEPENEVNQGDDIMSSPGTTPMSSQDATPVSGLDTTPVSYNEYPEYKNTVDVNVHVKKSLKTLRCSRRMSCSIFWRKSFRIGTREAGITGA